MRPLSSEAFVRALSLAGFAIYRRTAEATILERGGRAVTVRTCPRLDGGLLMDLRRMAGLSWQELEAIVEASPGADAEPGELLGPGPAAARSVGATASGATPPARAAAG